MPQSISRRSSTAQLKQDAAAPLYALIGEEDLLRDAGLTLKSSRRSWAETATTSIAICSMEMRRREARSRLRIRGGGVCAASSGDCESSGQAPRETRRSLAPLPQSSQRVHDNGVRCGEAGRAAEIHAATHADGRCRRLCPSQGLAAVPWLKQEGGSLGIRLEEEALHLLREACGGSLYAVRHEMEKLASYMSPTVAPCHGADVAALRGTQPGASVFDLAAAIGGRRRGTALAILARNLEAGEAPLRILGSLAWQYRRLWKVKDLMRQAGREGEASRLLRMDPYPDPTLSRTVCRITLARCPRTDPRHRRETQGWERGEARDAARSTCL